MPDIIRLRRFHPGAQLGLADRTEIAFFQGAHSINAHGTLTFPHKHLRWPLPDERQR